MAIENSQVLTGTASFFQRISIDILEILSMDWFKGNFTGKKTYF